MQHGQQAGDIVRRNVKTDDVSGQESTRIFVEIHPTTGNPVMGGVAGGTLWLFGGVNGRGLTYGGGSVHHSDVNWDGIPTNMLLRFVLQHSNDVEEAID